MGFNKNKFYEIILLLAAALILFNPSIVTHFISLPNKYFGYILGLCLWMLVLISQKIRLPKVRGA